DYTLEKLPGTVRIAVIGDSFVEGFRVDYHYTFSQVLEKTLNENTDSIVEVYNFGVTGAPLSQYLHIMRYVSETYAPDIYVVNLYYNDFDESFAQNVQQPEVLQFGLDENGDITEIPPRDPQLPFWRELVISPAVVRYVRFNLGYMTPSELWRAIKNEWTRSTQPAPSLPVDDGTPEIPTFQFRTELIANLLQYVFPQMQALAAESGSHLLLMMDCLRLDITQGNSMDEIQQAVGYRYNQAVADVSDERGIPLLDLTSSFYDDFQIHGQEFDFGKDGHWNAHAHNLVGHVLAERLITLEWLKPLPQ
ncbi:MAG TPA: SGNH/GDSL hydrolase family protein, partial [Aggregatilineales bacterium]|nr:SGNH/GDSL hydrolase family protein [Aggregatilineales bacterium]